MVIAESQLHVPAVLVQGNTCPVLDDQNAV